ncbi:NAD(P)H-dependent oxidoreductase [Erysipelothrix urinaevulpis]|uniref:NAD(P)H-dependent oxidoreductase n=1 Tax=Erysipelothrix urinaevulpis TaxID=2683717 RepID=UPI00135C8C46|nr:NAD(P)H-dependent oxidoreductase [Erysipelothrix urinaevulpis]
MKNTNLAIIVYSMSGTNYQMAKWAKAAAEEKGANVRLVKVQELAPDAVVQGNEVWKNTTEMMKDVALASSDDIEWADAIIFSAPTRFGNVPSQLKQFIDIQGPIWSQGKTMNKVVSAMTSAGNMHGGHEATIVSLYTSMMHWGAIIVPPAYTDEVIYKAGGNPYGTSVTVDQNGQMIEDVKDAVYHQTVRTLEIANKVK